MHIINAEVQNNGTEEHSKDAYREENDHSSESVVCYLEVVLSVQQETAQDTCGATDDVGNNIVDGSPQGETREYKEIQHCCTTANDTVKNQIPEFTV